MAVLRPVDKPIPTKSITLKIPVSLDDRLAKITQAAEERELIFPWQSDAIAYLDELASKAERELRPEIVALSRPSKRGLTAAADRCVPINRASATNPSGSPEQTSISAELSDDQRA
jgi:hypothetical protein